ncbi:hypothetical protein VTN00DRAFT_6222 [Thermoascus crustaceus]|uniref:uncharacterized protein n=1 Tax=Thermoascus crustaceus TaxID=5088 RepID=UPI003743259C
MVVSRSKKAAKLAQCKKGTLQKSPARGYAVPRQHSAIAANDFRNVTSHHPEQVNWSINNLPDIMYVFKPPVTNARTDEPPTMSYPIHGQYLREIPVLPDNISSNVEEFRVEAWMRLDRRIRLCDITNRMHPIFRIKPNALQQRGVRFRKAFSMLAWGSGNKKTAELEGEIVKAMIQKGIDPALNSTRGLTPGLIDPQLGEAGGRIPVPDQYAKKQSTTRPTTKPSVERCVIPEESEEYSSDETMSEASSGCSDESSEMECDEPVKAKSVDYTGLTIDDYIAHRESERQLLELLGAVEYNTPSSSPSPQTPEAVVDPREIELSGSGYSPFVRRLSMDSEDVEFYNNYMEKGSFDKVFEPPTLTLGPNGPQVYRFVDTAICSPSLESVFAESECNKETVDKESICSVLDEDMTRAGSPVPFDVLIQQYYLGERALAELLPYRKEPIDF